MKIPALAVLSFSCLHFLTGCLTSGGGSTTESTPPGFRTASFAYNLEEGRILLPPSTRINRECTDTGLATETIVLQPYAFPYELEGDSLKLMQGGPQTPRLGTGIQVYNAFVRVGRGTGLQGGWLLIGQRYRVVSGEASAEDLARYDRMMVSADMERRFIDVHYVFSGDSLSFFMDTKNAELLIADWNGLFSENPLDADSAKYAISLRLIERDVVERQGLKSGETVRLRMGNDRNRDYSSDASGHAAHHYDNTPETCPNDYSPVWYWDFLEANLKIVTD